MHIPSPPITQALSSKTFHPPPLDGSMPLTATYDWHARNSPNHRVFIFIKEDGTIRNVYWPEVVQAVWTGAKLVNRFTSQIALRKTPVVAIVAMTDTITYFTIMMSVLRANCIVFPISPRNSARAVAHLIIEVKVDHILMGHESSMHDLVHEAIDIAKLSNPMANVPKVSLAPLFQELFLQDFSSKAEDIPLQRQGLDDIIIYLHSSGSTAYPKPIPLTNHRFSQLALAPWFGEQDLCDKILSLHVMPMYHAMGTLQLCWTASTGLVIAAFQPKSPATLPTPDNLFEAARSTQCDILFCVPSFIEAWSKVPEYVDWMATRAGVLFGGGPLNKTVGDFLISKGVSIFVLYGSTEGGVMSPIIPATATSDWDYFQLPQFITPHMVPYGENLFELVLVSNDFCKPSVLNTKIDGIDAYATSDLLLAHPKKPGYWRVFGRADDQIIQSNGEKTNPGPLENTLNQDPHVAGAVMFGRGQFQTGVIVEPKTSFLFNPEDQDKLADFRNKIWPGIEQINKTAPQHSRIFKEMIIVSSPKKPFTYTAKNTARRQAILNDYEHEIDATYLAVEESTQSNIPGPREWSISAIKDFVREVVEKVLSSPVKDDDDIFQRGCDSLQATWIRNTIHRALRYDAGIDIRQTTANYVYEYPTINLLAGHVLAIAAGSAHLKDISSSGKLDAMDQMVKKYTMNFSHSIVKVTHPESSDEKTVLLTGSTGALGAHILHELLRSPRIKLIYALSRKGTCSIVDRQKMVLKDKGLEDDCEALHSGRVIFVEGDLTSDDFGINAQLLNEMSGSITHVIHNAWRVDFNLGLSSFETHVKGLRKLIDFCIKSQAKLIFISSVGVLQAISPEAEPPNEAPVPATFALSNGYTQSKWVSEQILEHAHRDAELDFLDVRVGQLTGGINGAWNVKEWIPNMVQISKIIGCIPTDDKTISWIPIHHAAAAIIDYLSVPSPNGPKYVHLIHPSPIPWTMVASVIATQLNIKIVEYHEWLHHFTNSKDTPAHAMHLLPFFKKLVGPFGDNKEAFGMTKAGRQAALASSETLRGIGTIQEEDVRSWLRYWKQMGII